jgi:hypothetical protein
MATVVISAAKVKELANAAITHIREERNKRNAEMLGKAMEPVTFLGFKLYQRSNVEADRYLKEIRWGFYPSMYARGDLALLKKLLLLAELGDPVTINEEDARALS